MSEENLKRLDGHDISVIMRLFSFFFKKFALVLVSRPSTGKGKLAGVLERLGFVVVSCSGALTEMAEADPKNPEMQKILKELRSGELVEKHHVLRAIHMKLGLNLGDSAIVFDGFPRKDVQAVDLKEILKDLNLPCFALELRCSREEANVRRSQRIHEAREKGNPPREEDVNEKKWNNRQDQYEEHYASLRKTLSEFACYRVIETTNGSKLENHCLALKEIVVFIVLTLLRLPKVVKDRYFSRV